MKNYIESGTHKFEVVHTVPETHKVWNIGKNMIPGYIAFCEVKPGTYDIIPETLLAIECEGAEDIMLAVAYVNGRNLYDTYKRMQTYVKKNKNPKTQITRRRVERIQKAIEAIKRII